MATLLPEKTVGPAQGLAQDANGRPAKQQRAVRVYPCSICPKTFKRSEHCSRHERGHTREKPFHCGHCGRRYARKDLVRRHELSFHPFELARSQRPPATDTILVGTTDTSITEATEATEETTAAARASQPTLDPSLQLHDEQMATSLRSPRVRVTAGTNPQDGTSSHNTDERSANMAEELATATPGSQASPTSLSRTNINQQPLENSQAPLLDNQFLVDMLDDAPGQRNQVQNSNPTPGQIYESEQVGSVMQPWDSNSTDWQSQDILHGHEFVGDPETVPNVQPAMNRQFEGYFQDVDFFSMLPSGGANAQADFGLTSYLFNSGFSPPINHDSSHERNGSITTPRSLSVAHGATAEHYEHTMAASSTSPLPTVVYEKPKKSPFPVIDDYIYSTIKEDVRKVILPLERINDFSIPNAQGLQRFLTSYFTCFHRHFPVLHIASLDLRSSPSHLILSMCAVGALYRLNRKAAKDLWSWANTMIELNVEPNTSDTMSPSRIATTQCKLLLSLFAVFGEDVTGLGLTNLGFWTTEYQLRRAALNLRPPDIKALSWQSWSLRETSKRILYGIFIMSSLITVTYDMSPGFSVTQDIDMEMPDEEQLWEATSSEQWEELLKSHNRQPLITVREAVTHLLFAKELSTSDPNLMNWTAFATTVVLHAVNIHMWHMMQFTQSFTAFAINKEDDNDLRARLAFQVEMALGRCYSLITVDRAERERMTDDAEGPVISNCLALLRSAYVRVFTGAGSFNRMLLLCNDTDHVASSIQSYIDGPQERNPFLTVAVNQAYGGLRTPIKAGYLLVRKTAALSWSVEHAVAAWDCALFVTKWIHEMEMQQQENPPNDEEAKNLSNFRELLTEVDSEYDGKGSLAAEITRVWACFLDDTWVWGITPRMGYVLRQFSKAFADGWSVKFPNGNENGPISR